MRLRPPVLCYPVCDLETECPVGWTPGKSSKQHTVDVHTTASSTTTASAVPSAHLPIPLPSFAVPQPPPQVPLTTQLPRLQDCIQLKPGSTVGDVFEALKRGVLSSSAATMHGEFVRADGRCVSRYQRTHKSSKSHDVHPQEQALNQQTTSGSVPSKVHQLRKDSIVDASNCVLRIQTNRKSVWQATSSVVLPSVSET